MVEPSACRWCGIARRGHGRQYADAVGYHVWVWPSQEQILARMKARRLAATVAREGALPVPVSDAMTKTFVPVASLREPDGEFAAYLRHPYRVGHDMPETGGTQ